MCACGRSSSCLCELRVTDMDVREAITEFMGTAQMADQWMKGKFPFGPLKGQRPVDLVLAGRGQEVLDLIEAMKSGAVL